MELYDKDGNRVYQPTLTLEQVLTAKNALEREAARQAGIANRSKGGTSIHNTKRGQADALAVLDILSQLTN